MEWQNFYRKKKSLRIFYDFSLVIRSGFEPETHSLEGCCSIQLSYRTIISGAKVHRKWEITKLLEVFSTFLLVFCSVIRTFTSTKSEDEE